MSLTEKFPFYINIYAILILRKICAKIAKILDI